MENLVSDYYDESGKHICSCGKPTTYQILSGGKEFYCKTCGNNGYYPEGEGGPIARLLAGSESDRERLKQMVYAEIKKRKNST